MIARVGYFEGLTDAQKQVQEENGKQRLLAALKSQPGFVAVLYLERPNGDRVSFSLWESEGLMEQAAVRVNAAHLLPGQRGEDIPSPSRVEIWTVRDHFFAPADAASPTANA